MSKSSRTLLCGTAVAVCAASLAVAAAYAQQQAQPFPRQNLQQMWETHQAQMRARVTGAKQQLQAACGEELRNFCSTVTPGEGRVVLCMQAHQDKLGKSCEMALLEVSRNIGHAINRMERFAEACLNDIRVYCGTAGGSITKCAVDNRASLSPQCQAIVAAIHTRQGQMQRQAQQPPQLSGLAIYSTDGMKLGEVTGVKRRPDGSVESIEAQLGSPLGIGTKGVLISPGDLRMKGDHIELQMVADQVRSILQGPRR